MGGEGKWPPEYDPLSWLDGVERAPVDNTLKRATLDANIWTRYRRDEISRLNYEWAMRMLLWMRNRHTVGLGQFFKDLAIQQKKSEAALRRRLKMTKTWRRTVAARKKKTKTTSRSSSRK